MHQLVSLVSRIMDRLLTVSITWWARSYWFVVNVRPLLSACKVNSWSQLPKRIFYVPELIFYKTGCPLLLQVSYLKRNFLYPQFFQKTNKIIQLKYLRLTFSRFIFWKNLRTPKRRFKINWLLKGQEIAFNATLSMHKYIILWNWTPQLQAC